MKTRGQALTEHQIFLKYFASIFDFFVGKQIRKKEFREDDKKQRRCFVIYFPPVG